MHSFGSSCGSATVGVEWGGSGPTQGTGERMAIVRGYEGVGNLKGEGAPDANRDPDRPEELEPA
ncbi:MAG: hypothetical protein AAF717_21255 [Bacteroidota bacterium]